MIQPQSTPSDTNQRSVTSSFLREEILCFRNTQLIAVAAKLNVAEYLKDSSKTAEHIARMVDADPDALYRLLRALASIGIFEEISDKAFSNNPASEMLLDETPGSLRNIAILYGEQWIWNVYGQLFHSVKNGEQAFGNVHGKNLYEYLQDDQNAALVFDRAMTAFSAIEADAIIKAYNFSLKHTVVDVGGGRGWLVLSLVRTNPNLAGIVFDLPSRQNEITAAENADARISFLYGDFFTEVPSGGDIYLMKSVLHNWDDASCVRILQNCRKAMGDKSVLLVIERVIPPGTGRSEAKLFDINMLVVAGGRERTEAEYRKIFSDAGFLLTKIIPTQTAMCIVEGVPGVER